MRKGEVMRPFRAPRSLDGKIAAKASPTRQSPRCKDKPTQQNTEDSEGPTELRVTRCIIKETEDDNTDKNSQAKTVLDDVDGNDQQWTIEAHSTRAVVVGVDLPSPCLSEFEDFLEKNVVGRQQPKEMATAPKKISNDEYWEGILQSEKRRIEALNNSHLVPVEDIMLDSSSNSAHLVPVEDIILESSSDDDDVPIAATLSARASNLATLATVAVAADKVRKPRKKKPPRSLTGGNGCIISLLGHLCTCRESNQTFGEAKNYCVA